MLTLAATDWHKTIAPMRRAANNPDDTHSPDQTSQNGHAGSLGRLGDCMRSATILHRFQVLLAEKRINGMNRKNTDTIRTGHHMNNRRSARIPVCRVVKERKCRAGKYHAIDLTVVPRHGVLAFP